MADKLSVINDALVLTGNNPTNTLGDGSPEDLVAQVAFQHAVDYVLASHNWNFATEWVEPTLIGPSDPDDYGTYTSVYQVPDGTLQTIKVAVNGMLTSYRIVGGDLYLSPGSGHVSVLRVVDPGPDQWPALFKRAVHYILMAHLYRGLNEDPGEAIRTESLGEEALSQARTRTDQQQRAGAIFIPTARKIRMERRGG